MGLQIRENTRFPPMFLLAANILFFLLAELPPIRATQPSATLHSGDGRTVKFVSRNSPDLRDQDFDSVATGAQTQGKWLVYTDYYYYGECEVITNTYKSLNRKVSSIRFVGASDNYMENSITLYKEISFQGGEFYTSKDTSFDGRASSLIVTGSSPWTLFASPNFGGDSVCVYPGDVYNTNNDLGISNNGIRSVRVGCVE